jgi:hypothetical protein
VQVWRVVAAATTQNIPIINIVEYLSNGYLGSYLQNKERLQPLKIVRVTLDIEREINYLHKSIWRNLSFSPKMRIEDQDSNSSQRIILAISKN